jgi:hypothetical protein
MEAVKNAVSGAAEKVGAAVEATKQVASAQVASQKEAVSLFYSGLEEKEERRGGGDSSRRPAASRQRKIKQNNKTLAHSSIPSFRPPLFN